MHFGYSLHADHKEEHVIVKKENSNRTYYDEVNSDKTSLLSRTILVPRVDKIFGICYAYSAWGA